MERLCRSRGLPTLDMVRRLVQHKFYNRTQVDVTHDQLQKYLQVYRHLLDKVSTSNIARTNKGSWLRRSNHLANKSN